MPKSNRWRRVQTFVLRFSLLCCSSHLSAVAQTATSEVDSAQLSKNALASKNAQVTIDNPSLNLATRDQALSTSESLAAIQTSPDIMIELVAAEPNVIDPVAARFDARGRLWVVEMRDYPTGPLDGKTFGGTIRILRDLDDDGVYEQATTFAQGLVFPTGLQPWRDGVIVTLAGRIAYMADSDNDDRCDHEETWFEGFAEENEQLRANHPIFGIDGRIYVAGGLRSSTIVSTDSRWAAHSTPVRLLNNDFAFDPTGGFWGSVAGDSQYGLSIDDFGNRLGVSNRNPAKLAVLPLSLVGHDPWLTPGSAIVDVSASGAESVVHPLAPAWTTSNLHSGQFSAACGVHEIAASGLPPSWQGNLLACEPTAYLVQRASVDTSGAVPRSTAVFDPGEAIASRDTWFRVVDAVGGPDGGVYLVDMHRAVIEHPQWVPVELKHRVDERYGNDCGRIYRIRDASSLTKTLEANFTHATANDLARLLDHPNRWQREEAARLLFELGQESTVAVRAIFSSLKTPAGLSRAAALLAKFDSLSLADCELLSQHDHHKLRAAMVMLATGLPGGAQWVATLLNDPAPAVRLAAAIALATDEAPLGDSVIVALSEAANAADNSDSFVLALGAVGDANVAPLLAASLHQETVDTQPIAARLTRRLAAMQPDVEPLWVNAPLSIPIAQAWVEGLARARKNPTTIVKSLPTAAQEQWSKVIEMASSIATDTQQTQHERSVAIRLAAFGDSESIVRLRTLRDQADDSNVRVAAIESCAAVGPDEHVQWLDTAIDQLPWPIAMRSVSVALSRPAGQAWVLDALASKRLPRGLVSPSDAARLLKSKDSDIAARAANVLQAVGEDRAKVIDRYRQEMPAVGDMTLGHQLFLKHCAACHRIAEHGFHVGPDISDTRTQTPETLLVSILDPSRAIDAGFVRYTVLTDDGRVVDGLLVDDRPDAITLKVSGGENLTVPRDQVQEQSTRGVSLMPDGFEQLLPPEEMSHLITFLKNWRYVSKE